MKTLLTNEQSDALQQSGEPLPVVDPRTQRVYVLVDQLTHDQAMDALKRQQLEDEAAIRQGLDDMEAGRGMTIEESQARTIAALARLSQ
jgi:predicted transcriptional regulator